MNKKKIISVILVIIMIFSEIPVIYANNGGMEGTNYSNLVVFVQFSDTGANFMENPTDVSNIVRNYTDTSFKKSLVSYIKKISYGKMNINTYLPQYNPSNNTITPVILDNTKSSYESANNEYAVERDAIEKILNCYDLSKYDLDQNADGYIDNVTFVFAGGTDVRGSIFYPHKTDFTGNDVKINNLPIWTINVLNGDGLLDETDINNIGVISHEFLHSLGYPDLYVEDGSATPVGRWDLMASSSDFMQYPLAYLRSNICVATLSA